MKTLAETLSKYSEYHMDRRNIATHFVGIPMIMVAVMALLSRPQLLVAGVPLAPVWLLAIFALVFYFRLDLRFGIAMTVFTGASVAAGFWLAALTTSAWLWSSAALFVVGWVFQFLGHYWEGKKPAFVDDMSNFLVGPLFIVAEAGFAFGLRTELLSSRAEGFPRATATAAPDQRS
jgi:uncharacterized membrane protein YGL010W